MEYNVYAIIPKNVNLDKCFIVICKKELKFKEMYDKAVEKNKLFERYLYIYENGGIENFNIVFIEKLWCKLSFIKNYLKYYKMYVDSFMKIRRNLQDITI